MRVLRLELAVRLHLVPGDGCLNVSMRLTGCNVDIILKLHIQVASDGLPRLAEAVAIKNPCSLVLQGWQLRSSAGQTLGSATYLGGHHRTWDEVDVGQVEEDRV